MNKMNQKPELKRGLHHWIIQLILKTILRFPNWFFLVPKA